jgi:hypothetical protein
MKKLVATLQPFGLAIVIASGFAMIYGAIVMIGLLMIDHAIQPREVARSVYIGPDGAPVIYEFQPGGSFAQRYLTLDGKEIQETPDISNAAMLFVPASPWAFNPAHGDLLATDIQLQRPPTNWYLVYEGREHGRAYFEGFDRASMLRAGYIGTRGFRADTPPPDERFTVDGRIEPFELYARGPVGVHGWDFADLYMASGNTVIEIDFRKRTIHTLLSADHLHSVGMMIPAIVWNANGAPVTKDRDSAPLLAVRESDRVLLFDSKGVEQGSYAIPDELRGEDFQFYQKDKLAIAMVTRARPPITNLYWFDRQGQISKRAEVVNSTQDPILQRPDLHCWVVAVTLPCPLAAVLEPAFGPDFRRQTDGTATAAFSQIWSAIGEHWPSLAVLCAISGVLACLAARRQRVYGQRDVSSWAVFVLVFGLPGFVAYRVHRRWPVRAACPWCNRLAPRDRETCVHCGKEFPRPEPKGSEVVAA